MKLLLVAAVVALTVALATGHYVPNEQDKSINLNQYFDNMKARVNQDLTDMMNKHNLPAQTRNLLERQQAELQAVPDQVKDALHEVERNFHKMMDNFRIKCGDIMQKMSATKH